MSTWQARVRAPSECVVLMSGENQAVPVKDEEKGSRLSFPPHNETFSRGFMFNYTGLCTFITLRRGGDAFAAVSLWRDLWSDFCHVFMASPCRGNGIISPYWFNSDCFFFFVFICSCVVHFYNNGNKNKNNSPLPGSKACSILHAAATY